MDISPLNPSDHCVVKLSLRYDVLIASINRGVQYDVDKIAWHKVTGVDVTLYRHDLDTRLEKCGLSDAVFKCNDVGCT